MTEIRVQDLLAEFPNDLRLFQGNKDQVILGPAAQENPKKNHVIYVASPKALARAREAGAACVVIDERGEGQLQAAELGDITLLLAKDVKLMMALINQRFFPVPHAKQPFSTEQIHPTAVIHPEAELAAGVRVGPNAVIAAGVQIGDQTYIGANTVIEANCRIGRGCYIHPQVFIGHSCILGNRVEIKPNTTVGGEGYGYAHSKDGFHRIPHYGGVTIGDDVHIGSGVNIDRGTYEPSRIGANTKIDNFCHLGHNIEIGKNCLITAGLITAGSAKIGNNCVFAGRVSVNGHISICDGVTIGPLSGVTNDVHKPGVYAGFPLIDFKESLKVQASLASLPRLRRSVAKILKKLGLEE